RVVVGGGADATAAKDRFRAGEGLAQDRRDARAIVADHLGPGQRQAALGQQLGDFRQVLVLAFARQDFVADDDQSKSSAHGDGGSVKGPGPAGGVGGALRTGPGPGSSTGSMGTISTGA